MIESIIVVGGGSAGLLAALTLKTKLPNLHVTVVHSKELGVIGVGEGTTPLVPAHLHGYLGVDVGEFIEQTRSSWKLGIRFLWGPRQHFDYTFTHQVDWKWSKLSKCNGFYCMDDFSGADLASELMSVGNVFTRKEDGEPLIERTFGYHAENKRLVSYLERSARQRGVEFRDDKVADVEVGEVGVESLRLESGQLLRADLFIDASGFGSLLLGKAMAEPYVDFGSTLFCNRAVLGSWERDEEPVLPYTTAETMNAGWCWQIEHPRRIARGYVYSSDFIDDGRAERELREKNPKITDTRTVRFPSGRYERSWVKNVVAVGNASGFVEPLEATSLHCICHASRRLAEGLIDSDCRPGPALTLSFNLAAANAWDQIRWFLGLHYKFNTRLNTPFWQTCRRDTQIGPAAEFVDFYKENGPSPYGRDTILCPNDMFGLEGYLTILVGMQVPHSRRHPVSALEHRIWSQIQSEHRTQAEEGMTIEEVNEIIQSPQWRWYPDYFLDDGLATFTR